MNLDELVRAIAPLDAEAMRRARERQTQLTKPAGSLGALEELAIRIAGITGTPVPALADKVIITLAADHGVTAAGVSAYPREVTAQMILNFLHGGAAINVLARHVGARVVVVDMGVASDIRADSLLSRKIGYGTADITKGPAMTREDALRAVETGIAVLEHEAVRGIDILGIGDMGIGNTTASSALTAAITGAAVEAVTGRGTGIDDLGLARKIDAIREAIRVNHPDRRDPLELLARLGGFELGGMAGAILAAAAHRIPVVLDGFVVGAAALLAYELAPAVKEYLIASHRSVERGHAAILTHIGVTPLLDLQMRLGEGTGAALGISLAEAACKLLKEMATFAEARVSPKAVRDR